MTPEITNVGSAPTFWAVPMTAVELSSQSAAEWVSVRKA